MLTKVMVVAVVAVFAQSASAQAPMLTNTDVTRLVAMHVSEQTMIAVIQEATATQFDLSPRAVSELAGQLVPPAVIAGLVAAGIVGCTLYVRHARTAPAPLLDLDLLKVDTFFASVVGGFLYRIGVGALPFLLPLMLQLGFGLNPMQSGLLTFASAVGAVAMKTTAAPILRRFGFKRVLVTNAVVSSLFLAAIALFTAGTPHWIILAVLLVGGFLKSLEFTSINSIAYADIDARAMSRATSFASVAQQLSLSAGVAIGALVLEAQRMGRGSEDVVAGDFPLAFVLVAAIAATSSLIFAMLPKEAGASLSARAHAVGEQEEPAPVSQI
jgi:hypothetical protein